MADVKFSDFPNAAAIESGDIVVGLQDGGNVQYTVDQLKTFCGGLPYKVFSAWYALSGLVITTFQNDFVGTTFTFTNPSNGVLNIVPSNPIFTSDKTIVISGTLNSSSNQYFVNGRALDVDIAIITLTKYDNSLSSTPNFSQLFIEIRVYN